MTFVRLLTHAGFFAFLFLASALLTLVMVRRVRIMDVPNDRSSHSVPTPKSGGVAFVSIFLIGSIWVYVVADVTRIANFHFFGFIACAAILATVSFIDDITQKSFLFKLAAQALCASFVLMADLVVRFANIPLIGIVELGPFAYLITFVWLLGLINTYNFMDGLDGLAAGVAVIAALFLAVIAFRESSYFVYISSLILAAGVAGFLVFNVSPAKIFMGDVGSAFLGFAFAMLAVIGASYDRGHLNFFLVPLLLFHFIFDAAFTFFRRLMNGENVLSPHRSHVYQLLNRLGRSHRQVAGLYYLATVVQGTAAWILIELPSPMRPWVFLPFLMIYFVVAVITVRKAQTSGLVPVGSISR
ncbi:MAG: glycosyltransferase family 4 protein [Rhodocyclales bacterium]|nr:glycosyltransferase family 4 protein [Rhodocyclales bacterium]